MRNGTSKHSYNKRSIDGKPKILKTLKQSIEIVIIDFRSELSLFFTEWQPAHTQFFVMTYFHIHTNMVNND